MASRSGATAGVMDYGLRSSDVVAEVQDVGFPSQFGAIFVDYRVGGPFYLFSAMRHAMDHSLLCGHVDSVWTPSVIINQLNRICNVRLADIDIDFYWASAPLAVA